MPFNSATFVLFFAVFAGVYHGLLRGRIQRLWCIAIGSLIFYGAWDWRFVPLLLTTAVTDFYLASWIQRESRAPRRRLYVALSATANLGLLAYFKYTNFFLDSGFALLRALGWSEAQAPVLAIVLPIGISFYTFQSLSYVIDVYRGELRARGRIVEFLAGVTFFPHLVAGPIIRATTLLPQFEALRPALDLATVRRALLLFAAGLFKKGVGDLLGFHADQFYAAPSGDLLESWIGTLAFTGQIYADFSGYTDMAIATALLLGIELPANFNQPYLASSPSDFWRRWHISLSSWLRDYLYIPLGGNRRHRQRNLLLTMLIGGLWHGANWTFVVWGAYHGALLVATHALGRALPAAAASTSAGLRVAKVAATFYLVHLGWVLFRAPQLDAALQVLGQLHGGSWPAHELGSELPRLASVVAGIVLCHAIQVIHRLDAGSERDEMWRYAAAGAVFALALAANGTLRPFIYFQF